MIPGRPNFTRWSHSQVQGWLQGIGLGAAAQAVRDADIDGRALAGLARLARSGVGGGAGGVGWGAGPHGGTPTGGAAAVERLLREEVGLAALGLRLRLLEALMTLFGAEPLL